MNAVAAANCNESFTPGTDVLLASGKAVPIATLKPGDKVLATNTKSGKTQAETVSAVLVNRDTDLYNLRIKAGTRTAVIHTTSSHLFWVPYLNQWTSSNKLTKSERLKTPEGQVAVVDGGSTPADHDGWMWDLTIQDDHDFYVVTVVAPVLVHNCGNTSVTFGHGARHLAGTGLDQTDVEAAIEAQVKDQASRANSTGSFWGRVKVDGKTIEYRAYTLPNGTINVGTYYVP